ncbi:MAG: SiaB family protein kinase [Methylotenera sp.]
MEIDLFGSFQDDADKKGIVFYYSGTLSQNAIATMGDILKQRLDNSDAKGAGTKKLFSSFIEMVQNALHYSPLVPDSSFEKIGAVAVGKLDDHFYIFCGNLVDRKYISRITEKIEAVNNMSRDEVKQAYRTQLRNYHHSDDEVSKGAGLGLLTLARDSISPIEYSFKDVPGYDNEYSELHLKTIF